MLNSIETGKRNISLEILNKIKETFNYSVDDLIYIDLEEQDKQQSELI